MSRIVLVGSSIFHGWDIAGEMAPRHLVVNRAVGGTTTGYWKEQLGGVLAEESPDAVCMYCGSNDLNENVTPGRILGNLADCRAIAEKAAGSPRFAYFTIIKAPQKLGKWELIDRINSEVNGILRSSDLHVELNEIFFKDGGPVAELFQEDALHLLPEAYRRMVSLSLPLVAEWLGAAQPSSIHRS